MSYPLPPLPENPTTGDIYRPAIAAKTVEEARAHFERDVERLMARGRAREEAQGISRANIAYFAGYFDTETMRRVEELYGAVHPVFGPQRGGAP